MTKTLNEIAFNEFFAPIIKQSKARDKAYRKNPLALKSVIAHFAHAEKMRQNAEKDKNTVLRVTFSESGFSCFWTKQNDKYIQTASLKMELSGIRKCAENNLHELSDEKFAAMIADCNFEITSIRTFSDNHFKSEAKTSNPALPKMTEENANALTSSEQTEMADYFNTNKRTEIEAYENFMQIFGKEFGVNFWDWAATIETEKLDAIANKYLSKKTSAELPALKSLAK